MSMPKTEGHSANVVEFREDALERKLLSMSRGGSNNQRLLAPSQKKGLAPARGAAASLPAAERDRSRDRGAAVEGEPRPLWGGASAAARKRVPLPSERRALRHHHDYAVAGGGGSGR